MRTKRVHRNDEGQDGSNAEASPRATSMTGAASRRNRYWLTTGAAIVIGLSLWRASLPSARISPDTQDSFNRKVDEIERASASGNVENIAFSEEELDSGLEGWYKAEHPDDGWPFGGTAFRFRAGSAHAYLPLFVFGGFRVVLVDLRVDASGIVLRQQPEYLWVGIIPIPCAFFAWVAKAFGGPPPQEFWRSWRVPYPVEDIRVIGDRLVVRTL